MPKPLDAVVVGGGPAGAAAAITLARAGREVVVLDKAVFPRDKCCGDGLTVWALRQLESLGWDPHSVDSFKPVDAGWVGSPSRPPIEFPLPAGQGLFAAVARRHELDVSILDLARKAGATVLDGVACTNARPADEHVEIEGAGGEIRLRARHLIGADGMWSPTRRFLGGATPGYRGEWHAFRQYFTGVGPEAAHKLFAWFEPDFLPGYAWSFPLAGGIANVGFGILRAGRWRVGAMGTLWPEILARPHIREVLGPNATAEGPHRAWPIPAALGAVPLAIGRALFVGDAAAAADPLTGEGIGQALATGTWAAEAVLAATRAGSIPNARDPDTAARLYRRRISAELAPDHRLSVLLSRALSHRKGARFAIRLASLTPWTRRNFARWLFEDYPRALLFTPRRWRDHSLTGEGAFRN